MSSYGLIELSPSNSKLPDDFIKRELVIQNTYIKQQHTIGNLLHNEGYHYRVNIAIVQATEVS